MKGRAMLRTLTKLLFLAIFAYCASYLFFRTLNIEVWDQDNRAYVIFPEDGRIVYLLFRPLSYADAALTGTGAHIGPHQ